MKGWVDASGTSYEKVFNVAWSDDRTLDKDGKLEVIKSTVNLAKPSWGNSVGDAQLAVVWTDPEFNSKHSAFYYARVIEIPTPRWTAFDKQRYDLELPKDIPMIAQERAYTSPIWYSGK